jgi:hypothetical protein
LFGLKYTIITCFREVEKGDRKDFKINYDLTLYRGIKKENINENDL